MNDLILHHYPLSPFSEKIRCMLGYTQLNWNSVLTREMPPRPQLAKLAGNYRKIPVAQIGADIFCDSRTIASEIAALSAKPELALETLDAEQQKFVAEVDLELFFACLMVCDIKVLQRKMREAMSILNVARFVWDRVKLGSKAKVDLIKLRDAKPRVREHLAALESRLQKQEFLFSSQPTHADFSSYHSLWILRDLSESPEVDCYKKVSAWMDRMKAFGEGGRTEITADQALAIAAAASPRPIASDDQNDIMIGKRVSIGPADYGQRTTSGYLVGSSDSQWILARKENNIALHVHFPKQGFNLIEL
ncbi:MAG: glutathione S-transferase family protein [Spongiibacteraceae bacterium]